MKRFQFTLERVLRVREAQEEAARARWQRAEYAARGEEEAARAAARAREEAVRALSSALERAALSPREVLVHHRALDRMADDVRTCVERARTLRLQADQVRAPWEELRREVRGLERLRERHRAAYRVEALRSEAAEIDEIATNRATRSPSGPAGKLPSTE